MYVKLIVTNLKRNTAKLKVYLESTVVNIEVFIILPIMSCATI